MKNGGEEPMSALLIDWNSYHFIIFIYGQTNVKYNLLTAMLTIRESVPGSSLIFGLLRFWPTAISVANFRT